jgi:hypothetical protein
VSGRAAGGGVFNAGRLAPLGLDLMGRTGLLSPNQWQQTTRRRKSARVPVMRKQGDVSRERRLVGPAVKVAGYARHR